MPERGNRLGGFAAKKAVIQLALCLIVMLVPLNAVSEEEYRFPPIVEGLNFVAGMDPSGHVVAVGSYKDSADARLAANIVVRSTG